MFKEWMINEKGYSWKSAHDVMSRQKRVRNILNIQRFNTRTIDALEKNTTFKKLSISVKSQLRNSVRLSLEFEFKNKRD